MFKPVSVISLNGSKAGGKSTLSNSLGALGYGVVIEFYGERYGFEKRFLHTLYDAKGFIRKWKSQAVLPFFALSWHRTLNKIESPIVFDHFYADFLVQNLNSIDNIDLFLEIIEFYDLPPFDKECVNLFIDHDYETYLIRRGKRVAESGKMEGVIPENYFNHRRSMYLELVKMGYLQHINANQSAESVLDEARKIIDKEVYGGVPLRLG